MRYNFIFGFVLFLFMSVGNVLAHSRGAVNAEVAARGLLNVVDKMSVGARQFDDIEDYLDRRELLEDLTTRELYEELNRRVILYPGGPNSTKMRCDLCGNMIPTKDIVTHRWQAHARRSGGGQ
ncbi:hypothetical protein FA15DRAFT_755383 [Coprinopsis marcescibilis]|nr:hypothetical protein FA15DRAFT_755383 [Coprinopsis marcescibilis]